MFLTLCKYAANGEGDKESVCTVYWVKLNHGDHLVNLSTYIGRYTLCFLFHFVGYAISVRVTALHRLCLYVRCDNM